MTDDELHAALSDVQALGLTLFGEARGEPIEGRVAVANVIRNRVRLGRWGPDYKSVCFAPWQFSCWQPVGGKDNYKVVLTAARALAAGRSARSIYLVLGECQWIAEGIVDGAVLDNTKGATHYFSTRMVGVPTWAVGQKPTCRIGGHLFFANVP
jgi:spore germination cell wall hydrolase CwlJ-like protein